VLGCRYPCREVPAIEKIRLRGERRARIEVEGGQGTKCTWQKKKAFSPSLSFIRTLFNHSSTATILFLSVCQLVPPVAHSTRIGLELINPPTSPRFTPV